MIAKSMRGFSLAALLACLVAGSIGCGARRGGSDVAATVDGHKIYLTDVEKYYQNNTAGSEQQPVGDRKSVV